MHFDLYDVIIIKFLRRSLFVIYKFSLDKKFEVLEVILWENFITHMTRRDIIDPPPDHTLIRDFYLMTPQVRFLRLQGP